MCNYVSTIVNFYFRKVDNLTLGSAINTGPKDLLYHAIPLILVKIVNNNKSSVQLISCGSFGFVLALLAVCAEKHMSRCHSQRLRTGGIQ